MLKKMLKLAGIGFLIGAVVGNVIAVLSGISDGEIQLFSQKLLEIAGGNQVLAAVLQSLFSGLYGAFCFCGISLYDMERLPLAAATALHCALIILPFIPIALLLGWFESITSLLIMSCFQLIGFIIIWLILYFVYKKQVRELNDMQKDFSEKDKE